MTHDPYRHPETFTSGHAGEWDSEEGDVMGAATITATHVRHGRKWRGALSAGAAPLAPPPFWSCGSFPRRPRGEGGFGGRGSKGARHPPPPPAAGGGEGGGSGPAGSPRRGPPGSPPGRGPPPPPPATSTAWAWPASTS